MKFSVILTLLFLSLYISVYSQKLSVGFDFGAGASYLGEDIDNENYINFKPGFTSVIHLKYQPKEAYFGLKFNYQYISTVYEANYWNYPREGEITTSTTSLFLEHLNTEKKWALGYFFGMGLTREKIVTYDPYEKLSDVSNFMSIGFGGLLNHQINENSALKLTPLALWTDPINTFRPNNYYRGREDISLYMTLGYAYSF
ncbi:MAG: hypothetical protein ACPGRC_09980 [Salibacteraceae bacterium]